MKCYDTPIMKSSIGEDLEFDISRLVRDIKNLSPYYENTTGRTQTNDTPFDNVNRPAHYNTGKYESIDVMVETQGVDAVKNFCICNAFKYIYRHRFKNGVEDIKKAIWYLNKYVELEEPNESK